ncbi:unnamed protein product [Pleuronectes platessa]|uniref:Uncharacterized protein n=1 Tax=Pleuronectes platessa TaxID=8262 RepID=A0A9N7V0I4_PLEPL|nr:unnamed protein product [Pleuronectes platessa]
MQPNINYDSLFVSPWFWSDLPQAAALCRQEQQGKCVQVRESQGAFEHAHGKPLADRGDLPCIRVGRKVLFMTICLLDEGPTLMSVFVDSANSHTYFQKPEVVAVSLYTLT